MCILLLETKIQRSGKATQVKTYEVGTIIVQSRGDVIYEIKEIRENIDGYEYFCESSEDKATCWVSDTSLHKFLDEGKGYIDGEQPLTEKRNRLDSIE
jgi:hypothetical protein